MDNKYKSANSFKVWILVYIFLVTAYRMIKTFYFPEVPVVSDKVILGTVLFSLVYIWIKEVRDRQALEQINIRLTQAHERLKLANINTIASLILSVEAKDPYTRGHSERVMKYSLAIGKKMNLPQGQLDILRNACILHDVGKIGIPDSILHKKEKLTDQDWEIIKKHPQNGIDILKPLDFLGREKLLILHHHERYDGTGYPGGLKGQDIPEGARIIALADSYDAMKSKRPYRDPLLDHVITEEIAKNIGKQFDPRIVNIFAGLVENEFKLKE